MILSVLMVASVEVGGWGQWAEAEAIAQFPRMLISNNLTQNQTQAIFEGMTSVWTSTVTAVMTELEQWCGLPVSRPAPVNLMHRWMMAMNSPEAAPRLMESVATAIVQH